MKENIHGYVVQKGRFWHLLITYREDGVASRYWKATRVHFSKPRRRAEDMLRKELAALYEECRMIRHLEQWELDVRPLYQPVSQYLDRWLENARSSLRPNSVLTYSSVIRRAGVYFDKCVPELRLLTPAHIISFYEMLRNNGLSEGTIRYHGTVLRMILQDAVDQGYLRSNPSNGILLPKAAPNVPEPYTEKEQQLLLKAAKGTEMELILYLAMFYGLRRGEICGLCWEDINFERALITIRHNVAKTDPDSGCRKSVELSQKTKTASSRRSFPMHPQIRQLLSERKAACDSVAGPIFCGQSGGVLHPDTLTKRFRKFLSDNGMRPIRLHDLRHGCGTLLAQKGCDLPEIQAYLGHASQLTTLQYVHLDAQIMNDMCHRMESILQRAI